MEKMLTEVCAELNNYFWRDKRNMKLKIEGGTFNCDFLQNGQYFRIIGSIFNDGVHKYPATDLHDEEFDGSIWSMAVPQAVIDLVSDIGAWQTQYGGVNSPAMSPFTSESFGNYSYSKGSAASGASSGNSNSWQAVFAPRLNKWRRLRNL